MRTWLSLSLPLGLAVALSPAGCGDDADEGGAGSGTDSGSASASGDAGDGGGPDDGGDGGDDGGSGSTGGGSATTSGDAGTDTGGGSGSSTDTTDGGGSGSSGTDTSSGDTGSSDSGTSGSSSGTTTGGTSSGTSGTTSTSSTTSSGTTTTTTTSTSSGTTTTTTTMSMCEGLGSTGLILHTTLDDAGSVTTPAAGHGTGVVNTNPPNDFVPALSGNGVRLNSGTENVVYPQSTGTNMDNVDLSQGTVDFCYRPFYDSDPLLTNPGEYGLFETSDEGQGWIRLRVSGSNNGLQIITYSEADGVTEQIIPLASFQFLQGEWYRITVSWDFTVGSGVQNLFMYIDGVEMTPNPAATTGPRTMGSADTDGDVFIGSIAANIWDANGVIDDFKVYDSALVP